MDSTLALGAFRIARGAGGEVGGEAGGEAVREREPRRAGEASPKPPPKPRSGLCPSCWPIFGFRNLLGAPRGRRGQLSVQSDNRFSGRGGGVGSLPRAWRRVGVPGAAGAKKKSVRLASAFPSPPFWSSDFAGPGRPRLYGSHTGTRSLSNRKGRGRRSGGREREPRRAGVEQCIEQCIKQCIKQCIHHPSTPLIRSPELLADFRIPKPPGCSQGAQRAVFCAV